MLRDWSGFFGLALAVAAAGNIGSTSRLWAAEAEPTISQEVLSLPELAVVRDTAAGQAVPMVGDEVRILGTSTDVPGLTADLQIKFEDPLGEDHLSNQGWVLVQPETKLKQAPGVTSLEYSFLISPIKGGKVVLPILVLKDSAGKALARTKPLEIEVGSAIAPDDPNPYEMVPARPPMSLPFPWWVAIFSGIVILGLLGGLIYWLIRFSKNRKKIVHAEIVAPPRPEDEVALEELKSLESKNYPSESKFKNHYFAVSEILKAYLGRRFGFDASESTAKEIILFFESSKLISDQYVDRIETLFEKLDPVKYSDHIPDLDEAKWVIQETRGIVQATRRIPAPEPILPGSLASGSETGGPRAP